MTDIFDQAKEELKQEQLINFIKKNVTYWLLILIFIVVIVIITNNYFNNKKITHQKNAQIYYNALKLLEKNSNDKIAFESLDYLILQQADHFSSLAAFKKAGMLALSDQKAAIELYDQIAKDPKVEAAHQDLSRLSALRLIMNDASLEESKRRFKELSKQGRPFYGTSKLLKAACLSGADKESAFKILNELIDENANINLTNRAKAVLAIIEEE